MRYTVYRRRLAMDDEILFIRDSTPQLASLYKYVMKIEAIYEGYAIAAYTPFLVQYDGELYDDNVVGAGLVDIEYLDVEYILFSELETISYCLHNDYYRLEHVLELEYRAKMLRPRLRRRIREAVNMYRAALDAHRLLN
jgi:hypothetical protein